MTRPLLATLLALSLFGHSKPVDYAQSILPLSWTSQKEESPGFILHNVSDGVYHMPVQDDEGGTEVRNHCSAWAYQTPAGPMGAYKTHWITAAHCVVDSEGNVEQHDYMVGGARVEVEKADVYHDLASLTGFEAPGLQLAAEAPKLGDQLSIRGYPMGWEVLTITAGVFSATDPLDVKEDNYHLVTVFNVAVAPGSSGSAIFDREGRVVGDVQITFCVGLMWQGFCPVGAGASLSEVRAFVATLTGS